MNMNIFEIKKLSKNFGGVRAVDSLSFSLREGSITGLIGPNGAGKTTLFNLITAYLEPDKGAIYYQGKKINGFLPHRVASLGIGRLFQDVRVFNKLTVLENVLVAMKENYEENPFAPIFFRRKMMRQEEENKAAALKWLEFVGLSEKQSALAENLSYGQQKLLSLARLLSNDAKLLLLDEPVSGIHPEMINKILSLLKKLAQQGRTILLIEHNLEAVLRVSDWVMLLDQGKLVAFGLPSEIKQDQTLKRVYLGVP